MIASEATFYTAVAFALDREGGYSNDPHDPGGETAFGIDKRSHPGVDIKALTREDAIAIYRRVYWAATKADQLPAGLAILYFDACVNQGAGAAAHMLQLALGVTADGVVGPGTLAMAAKAGPPVLTEYAALRGHRYAETANEDRFGLGWMRRLMACLVLAVGAAAPAVPAVPRQPSGG